MVGPMPSRSVSMWSMISHHLQISSSASSSAPSWKYIHTEAKALIVSYSHSYIIEPLIYEDGTAQPTLKKLDFSSSQYVVNMLI